MTGEQESELRWLRWVDDHYMVHEDWMVERLAELEALEAAERRQVDLFLS